MDNNSSFYRLESRPDYLKKSDEDVEFLFLFDSELKVKNCLSSIFFYSNKQIFRVECFQLEKRPNAIYHGHERKFIL